MASNVEQEKQHEVPDGVQNVVTDGDRRRHRKGGVSPRRVRRRRKDCVPQEDQAPGSQRCFREAAAVHRRHGGLPERAFCQQDATCVGARATDYPGDLRQALRQGAEERLQRCRGNCRSSVTAEPAVRPREEPGSAGPAGLPSGASRTATINQIRAFLIEQGIAVRAGPRALRKSLLAILENRKDEISPRLAKLILGLYEDWCQLDERIETVSAEIEALSRTEAKCRRLMSVPGVGPLISTGIVAAIGAGESFERGRDFGAWLGLVPRQYSTGGRSILGRISKRGSKYLRTLLIQAAKVLLMRPHNWARYSFGGWLKTASGRLHRNKLAVALANKLARIAWSVLRNDKAFDTHLEVAAI